MKLLCVEDVIMEKTAVKTFTKDREYGAYKTKLKDSYGFITVIRAKNDQDERHIIKEIGSNKLDIFFDKHFKVIQ